MTKIIITIFILYLLYKLVFDFVVPVSRTASQLKSQVNEVKRRQEEQLRNQQKQQAAAQPKKTATTVKNTTTTDGEYIEYEDVK